MRFCLIFILILTELICVTRFLVYNMDDYFQFHHNMVFRIYGESAFHQREIQFYGEDLYYKVYRNDDDNDYCKHLLFQNLVYIHILHQSKSSEIHKEENDVVDVFNLSFLF